MGEVDPAFIQSLENRPKPSIVEAQGIPIIDLSPISSIDLLSNNANIIEKIGDIVAQVGEACEQWGFFQVINHGVPLAKLEKLEVVAREFFALPFEEKRKVSRDEINSLGYHDTEHTRNVRDWKEVFDFACEDPITYRVSPLEEPTSFVSRWPTNPFDLREVAQEYGREVEKLAFKLLELISLSLGLPANKLNGFFKDSTSSFRLNYYSPCTSPDLTLGVGQHKDLGALAILAQDDVGGLQVLRKSDGEWVKVQPIPGAFVINVGDAFQVWSNDKYLSAEHRVMVNSVKDRLSIPFFFSPAHDVMVKPLDELINEKNHAKYTEYNWGEFYTTKKYGNFKKLNVENIQISDFRISE